MSIAAMDPSILEGGLFADHGGRVLGAAITFILLCTLSLVLRFVSLRVGNRRPSLEDWLMIPAWVLLMGLCANVIVSVKLGGGGRHMLYLLKFNPVALETFSQNLFVTELIYGILMALEKTTILLLYLRLFQIHRWFRITTYLLLVFIWMWGISESTVAIFQCKPIDAQWNKKIQGHCINQLAYYRYVRVPNLIHDVVMLVLPLPVVWQLKIAMQQRIALLSIFLLGSLGCVASLISMIYFFKLDAFSDATWVTVQLMSWTLAEPSVIFICSCMPALRPLAALFIPKIAPMANTDRNTSNQYKFKESKPQRSDSSTSESYDSVPLNSSSNTLGMNSRDGTPTKYAGTRHRPTISVTKAFSWEVLHDDEPRNSR